MSDFYILDENRKPVRVKDVLEWAKWMETKTRDGDDPRRVAHTTIDDFVGKPGISISTVFLGLDHRHRHFGDQGSPLIFETMIFGGEHDQWQDRCSTWEGALAMHERAVDLASGANQNTSDKYG